MEDYRIKRSLLQSFSSVAGGLQGRINTADGILTTFIGPNGGPQGPPPNPNQEKEIDELVTFINFYKAYMLFNAFINTSRNKYDEFVRTIIPVSYTHLRAHETN